MGCVQRRGRAGVGARAGKVWRGERGTDGVILVEWLGDPGAVKVVAAEDRQDPDLELAQRLAPPVFAHVSILAVAGRCPWRGDSRELS